MWVVAIILTGMSLFFLLRSLAVSAFSSDTQDYHLDFYHAQIADINRQYEQALISVSDADYTKAQIARDLLKAQTSTSPRLSNLNVIRACSVALLVIIPAIALPCYALIGSPNLIDLPLLTRQKPVTVSMSQTEQLEGALKANPNNAYFVDRLLKIYLSEKKFDDAARLMQDINTRLGATAAREADLGEMLMAANNGTISEQSLAAFERALILDPKFSKARYYTGRAALQDKNIDQARKIWEALVADMPEGALRGMVEGEIKKLDAK
jgi:cytochrome c-type biogenesis protein CcmH